MRTKMSKAKVKCIFAKQIKVPYCALQNLLRFSEPVGFTSTKVYGWTANVYDCGNGICLVTGYETFGNIETDSLTRAYYEGKARNIMENPSMSIAEQRQEILKLLQEFVQKATKGN